MNNDAVAERAILSAIINHGFDAYVEAADIVTENSFSLDSNKNIYKCLSYILEKDQKSKIDIGLILSAAQTLNIQELFTSSEEKKHLRAVASMPSSVENVRKLSAKIRKLEIGKELTRQLSESIYDLENITGEETLSTILQIPEKKIFDFSNLLIGNNEEVKNIGKGIKDWVKHLAENPVQQIGIATGLKRYDAAIGGGLRIGTINVIGARPKTGKTTLGTQMATNIASQNIPIFYADTEMQEDDHRLRNVSRMSGVKASLIETGMFAKNEEQYQSVNDSADIIENLPYTFMSVAGQAFEETLGHLRRWIIKNVGFNKNGKANPCVIFYDYLKLMDDNLLKNMKEYQAIGFIMTGLHNFAIKYGVPIVAFCQLNRDGIESEGTDAAAGSDRIIWLCSNFSIYKWQSQEEIADQFSPGNKKYNLKLITLIARHGPALKDNDYINILGEYDYYKITEGPTKLELLGKSKFQVENSNEEIKFE